MKNWYSITAFFIYNNKSGLQVEDLFVLSRIATLPTKTQLDLNLEVKPAGKGFISEIYYTNNTAGNVPLEFLEKQWETDMEMKYLTRIHCSSICTRHGVIQFKVGHRLHYSNKRLAKIYPDLDSECHRCKQYTADLINMFWSCWKLTQIWQSIFNATTASYATPLNLHLWFFWGRSSWCTSKSYSGKFSALLHLICIIAQGAFPSCFYKLD